MKLQERNQQQEQNFYQIISQPNPIQKKTLVSPYTIFPQKQLPQFTYTTEAQQTQQFQTLLKKQILILEDKNFSNLFKEPVYISSKRIKIGTNSQYGVVQARAQQSKIHSPLNIIQKNSQICFQSKFQSGNLAFAAKSSKSQNQYYLLLHKDINTKKCTQWFFFQVKNNQFIGQITFHILNFIKNYSTFQNGMKIAYSSNKQKYKWMRGCYNIKYRKTNVPQNVFRNYYALSFTYKFQKQNQSVYFAYSYPYTFSMLDHFLLDLSNNYSHIVKRKTLAYTPANNYVDLLTITNYDSNINPNKKPKKTVFITARVHPGQTPSSFVIQGLIKFLIGNTLQAQSLRNFFIFKIVPMLNPDGVVNGNYRCSLSGNDLNRVWHRADKDYHPQIYYVRKQILQLKRVYMYIDIHAHSKKKGIFMYGCQNKNNPYICRQIPFLFWKNVSHFNYYQCNFNIQKGRQGTSRLNICKSIGIQYCYTMQHSFCGPIKQKVHFTALDYNNVGKNIALTLQKYFCKLRNQQSEDLTDFEQLYASKELLAVGDKEDDSSSSDQQLQPIKSKAPKEQDCSSPRKLIFKRQKNPTKLIKKSISQGQPNLMSQTARIRQSSPDKLNCTRYNPELFKMPIRYPEMSIPIVNPVFKQDKQLRFSNKFDNFRGAYSSLSNKKPKDQQIKQSSEVVIINRYAQQQVNTLSDLFLPSLKTVSYKKYGRQKMSKTKLIQIAKPFSQRSCIIKEEIKKTDKKKLNLKQKILKQLKYD